MASRLLASFLLAAFTVPAFAQVATDEEAERFRGLVAELGAPDFAAREQAFQALWRAGRPALPFVEEATRSDDLETRERAERLVPLLTWSITPDLWERCGPTLQGYGSASSEEKVQILGQVRREAGRAALPFFRAVLESEDVSEVWEAGLGECRQLAGDEVVGWLEALAETGRAAGPVYRHLADQYARLAPEDLPRDRILRYTEAILARTERFADPLVYSHWMAALMTLGEEDLADRVFEAGLDAAGADREYRFEGARRLLAVDRLERALAVLEPLAAEASAVPAIATILCEHRRAKAAWDVAARALAAFPAEESMKQQLFATFRANLEFEYALAVAEAMKEPDREQLATLYRYTLDHEKGTALRREAYERARREHPDDPSAWAGPFAALVDEHLYHGLAAEAHALCREAPPELAASPAVVPVAIRAAAAAGDDAAVYRLEETHRDVLPPGDPDLGRALLTAALARNDRARIVEFAALAGGEVDLALRAYAATGERTVLEARPVLRMQESMQFDATFALGQIAEREGKPGEALYQYARALAEIGSVPNTRLAWHGDEVARKAAYLGRVDGAVREARAAAARIADRSLRERIDAEILRQTGDWAGAALRFDAMLEALGTDSASTEDRLDAAWTHVRAGGLERAEALLAPLAAEGPGTVHGRLALHVRRIAAEGERAEAIGRTLFGRRVSPEVAYASAFYLTCRGIDGPAREEWETIVAATDPGHNFPFYLSNAWEYLTIVDDRHDAEPARCAEFFLRGLQACWVNNYTIIERGGEPSYRARIEHWRGRVALEAGDREEAIRAFRRALGHFPWHVPSAQELAGLVAGDDPDLAARARQLATEELRRRALSEPANPEAHYRLGLALEADGAAEEALTAARKAIALDPEDERYAELADRLGK